MSIGGEPSSGSLHFYVGDDGDDGHGGYLVNLGCNDMLGDFTFTTTREGFGTLEVGVGRSLATICLEADDPVRNFYGTYEWELNGRVLRLSGATEMVFESTDDIDERL